ncbi:hypothetical protein PLESTB_000958100 [Pleodorina starrii]|uniref:DUF1365-domain-containing protein n=1 Tax=Pleodorina starrii TaxID=330485 RepID=A0A9W6C2Q1_9CHLO|nr:hypothetical protein PLESTM_001140000 [Pleodorina starrii]GLC77828.1 hypothetical protein PLESTB_000958100 [Pleodorina starrii]
MDWLLFAQALNLIGCNIYYTILAILSLPSLLLYYVGLRKGKGEDDAPNSATFYEGQVLHIRRAPVHNQFRYAVRMAVLDLDNPPSWFKFQAKDHMTADEARKFAGTRGPVKLLTDPVSAGYIMNPISVYYCYSGASSGNEQHEARDVPQERSGRLVLCIAEVTNTPWNERVTFVFDPAGQSVCKALHVSPFMDMQNTWHLEAPEPSDRLKLVVRASHPEHGDYFYANLVGRRSDRPARVNEEAGLGALTRYGFMPHRVAALIYWQAVKLLVKGVPFCPPPSKAYQRELLQGQGQGESEQPGRNVAAAAETNGGVSNGHTNGQGGGGLCPVAAVVRGASKSATKHSHPRNGANGQHFLWREAPGWPWRES